MLSDEDITALVQHVKRALKEKHMLAEEDLILLVNHITQTFYSEVIDETLVLAAIRTWVESTF